MKKQLYLIMLLVGMTGCYSTKQVSMLGDYQHACTGLTKEMAVNHFGTPNRSYQSEKGEVLVFESYEGEHTICNRRFLELTFNQEGICTGVETNYTKPEKYRDDKKTNWVVWGSITGAAVAGGLAALLTYGISQIGK